MTEKPVTSSTLRSCLISSAGILAIDVNRNFLLEVTNLLKSKYLTQMCCCLRICLAKKDGGDGSLLVDIIFSMEKSLSNNLFNKMLDQNRSKTFFFFLFQITSIIALKCRLFRE